LDNAFYEGEHLAPVLVCDVRWWINGKCNVQWSDLFCNKTLNNMISISF
jgi:hypothetical protein